MTRKRQMEWTYLLIVFVCFALSTQAKKNATPVPGIDIENPNRAGNKVMKASDLTTPIEMSRKER